MSASAGSFLPFKELTLHNSELSRRNLQQATRLHKISKLYETAWDMRHQEWEPVCKYRLCFQLDAIPRERKASRQHAGAEQTQAPGSERLRETVISERQCLPSTWWDPLKNALVLVNTSSRPLKLSTPPQKHSWITGYSDEQLWCYHLPFETGPNHSGGGTGTGTLIKGIPAAATVFFPAALW